MLTRETLHGVLSWLPTPWLADGSLDEQTFRDNVRRLLSAGIHGVYTAMSAGEVQSITLVEHERLTELMVEEVQRVRSSRGRAVPSTPASEGAWAIAGCTAPNTAEAVRRARVAQRCGADAVAVALPYLVPLRREEAHRFFLDLAEACPDLPLLHYQTPRCGRLLDLADYVYLADAVPSLVGSKQTGNDFGFFLDLMRTTPQLVHLRVDALVPEMLTGARGCISAVATLNPGFILNLYRLCREQRWAEALREQFRLRAFAEDLQSFIQQGYLDPVIDKALTDLAGFCRAGAPRRPFLPVPPDVEAQLRTLLRERHPYLLFHNEDGSSAGCAHEGGQA